MKRMAIGVLCARGACGGAGADEALTGAQDHHGLSGVTPVSAPDDPGPIYREKGILHISGQPGLPIDAQVVFWSVRWRDAVLSTL